MIPMATPAASARGIERMPPTSAATMARSSTPGPRVMVSVAVELVSGIVRIMLNVASTPASVHTIVDIFFGLIPESRAASGLAAEARIARPCFVWLRKMVRKIATSGTKTRTSRCSLRMNNPSNCQVNENAVGNAPYVSNLGRTNWKNSRSCATPIVATNSTTLGDRNSRRTTVSSTAAPTMPPTTTHAGIAIQ